MLAPITQPANANAPAAASACGDAKAKTMIAATSGDAERGYERRQLRPDRHAAKAGAGRTARTISSATKIGAKVSAK